MPSLGVRSPWYNGLPTLPSKTVWFKITVNNKTEKKNDLLGWATYMQPE